jgi:SulP family sulfate permease
MEPDGSRYQMTLRIIKNVSPGWIGFVSKHIPMAGELRFYNKNTLCSDLRAGASVALVSLPQAIGFALIAGLPPHVVITGVMVTGVIAAFFCSSCHTVIGPTNTTSIFVAAIVAGGIAPALNPVQTAVFMAFIVGVIQLAAGLVRVGKITQFISRSVILGYGAGAALLIFFGQLPTFLGVQSVRGKPFAIISHTIVEFARLHINVCALALGFGSLVVLLVIKRLRPGWPGSIIVLALATVITILFKLDAAHGVRTVAELGGLAAAMPVFSGLPPRELASEIVSLVNPALTLALIGMLEAISIAKNIAATTGQRIDPNQELIGLGAGNLAASLFGAMSGSGSFVRSAVNVQSGGRTQVAAIVSALGLGVILWAVAPLAASIPLPAVAAILLVVAVQMINHLHIRTVCRATRSDMAVFLITFAGTLLLNLDTAIYLGIGASLALFLIKAASPSLVEYAINGSGDFAIIENPVARPDPQISIVHVEGDLFFGASDLFQDHIRVLAADPGLQAVILRLKNARHLDGSTVLAIEQLNAMLRKTNRHLLISGVHGDVARVLKRSGLVNRIGLENIFAAEENATMATKKALKRAQALIGAKAGVRIFYNKAKETSPAHA